MSKKNLLRVFFSLANLRRQYLGNGWSDLLETFTDLDHGCGSESVKVSSKSDQPFPRYCRRKLAKKRPDSAIALYDRFFQPTSDGNISETVGLINLKLSQIRAHIHGQNL